MLMLKVYVILILVNNTTTPPYKGDTPMNESIKTLESLGAFEIVANGVKIKLEDKVYSASELKFLIFKSFHIV